MGSDDADLAEAAAELPSVDDVKPAEEGGPAARIGFSYQDEVAVGLALEMLANPNVTKIHCETHDDMIVVSIEENPEGGKSLVVAEYVQIKGGGAETLYSAANLCTRVDKKPGTSLFETSLGRDRHKEVSRFRLITNRPVKSELEILTYPLGAPGREVDGERFKSLVSDIAGRMSGVVSAKGIHAFETGSELRAGLTRWIGYYNTDRPHSALAGATPDEAYGQIEVQPYPGLAPDRAAPERKLAA